MTDLDLIKKFSKIRIKDICDLYNINTSNLWRGNTAQKNIDFVLREIIKECLLLILIYQARFRKSTKDETEDTL